MDELWTPIIFTFMDTHYSLVHLWTPITSYKRVMGVHKCFETLFFIEWLAAMMLKKEDEA